MSNNGDSQNRFEEQENLSEGTCPSNNSYEEGSRSTPSNLPKATTRKRKKKTSDSEDEDFVVDKEVTSKKKVVKKEFGTVASTKPGLHKKAPAKRVPMSKARASTLEASKSTKEEAASEGKKRKERAKKTMARVIGKPSMMIQSDEEEEEEDDAPVSKTQKLMGDAIKSGAAPSKPKTAPKLLLQPPKLHQREAPGTYQLLKRTRPQCLK